MDGPIRLLGETNLCMQVDAMMLSSIGLHDAEHPGTNARLESLRRFAFFVVFEDSVLCNQAYSVCIGLHSRLSIQY